MKKKKKYLNFRLKVMVKKDKKNFYLIEIG